MKARLVLLALAGCLAGSALLSIMAWLINRERPELAAAVQARSTEIAAEEQRVRDRATGGLPPQATAQLSLEAALTEVLQVRPVIVEGDDNLLIDYEVGDRLGGGAGLERDTGWVLSALDEAGQDYERVFISALRGGFRVMEAVYTRQDARNFSADGTPLRAWDYAESLWVHPDYE